MPEHDSTTAPAGWTRIAGPGCPPAPRLIPDAPERCVLVLCAEMVDGTVCTTLYRVTDGPGFDWHSVPGVRRPAILAVVGDDLMDNKRERLDCGCRGGRICVRHGEKWAREWWAEAHNRDRERGFYAALADGKTRRYPDNPKRRATRAEALADARAAGLPCVLILDGHGKRIDLVEVPRG